MYLSTTISNTHPVTLNQGDLNDWAREARELEDSLGYVREVTTLVRNQRDRARAIAGWLFWVVLGLLAALIYAGYRLHAKPEPAPIERCAADVLQLDPTVISAAKLPAVEI